jgi:hypothetical protein
MKTRDTVKIGVSLAMLVGAAALLVVWLTRPAEGAGGEVTCWLCTNSACGKEFTKPVMEIARLRQSQPDANPACPHCGKATTVRCIPCPACGKYLKPIGHGFLPRTCPQCQQPIVTPPDQGSRPVEARSSTPAPQQSSTPAQQQSSK